jgi:histidine ammonia-lyase
VARSADTAVVIGEKPIAVADVVKVALGAGVELSSQARDRIKATRIVVDELVGGETPIYGLNTGLGHLRDQRVPIETLRDYQEAIVRLHAGGMGPPLPTPVVRAAMVARVAGIALGGAGATLTTAETLVRMLNRRVHPIVPSVGSVGASDLMHMAAIALVLIGRGRAEVDGEILSGADALARVEMTPLRMEPKDGLALISANGVAVGHAALVVDRAIRTSDAIDVVAAISLEARRGNPSIVEPVVAAAKPIPGQIEAARHIRELLSGSSLCQAGGPASVQDPLSFRVVPQVHGALRELVAFAHRAVEDELASMDDNPLVVPAEGRIVSNGNFHPMLMALAFDALRPALAHVGKLSERRTAHHFDDFTSDPEAFADGGIRITEMLGSTVLLAYAAAARYAELRQLADPATLDLPSLDVGVEDHATSAPLTIERTESALDLLDDLLAVELLSARALLRMIGDPERRAGTGTAAVLKSIEAKLAELDADAPSEESHALVRGLLPDVLIDAAEGRGA